MCPEDTEETEDFAEFEAAENVSSSAWEGVVAEESAGWRLDVWLVSQWPERSRSEIQRAITAGFFRVGDECGKSSTVLKAGDKVRARCHGANLFDERKTSWQQRTMELDILYEDEHLLVVDKPAGMVTHPGAGTREATLIEGVMGYLDLEGDDPEARSFRFGLVHRLDKDTSGALVIAKDSSSHHHLSQQFARKTTSREYIALLDGCLPEAEVQIEGYLHRSPWHRTRYQWVDRHLCEQRYPEGPPRGYRLARSHFIRTLRFAQRFDLCSVHLATGRTHQIRVHARALRCPVLADTTYGFGRHCNLQRFLKEAGHSAPFVKRQMLHARCLGFEHPRRSEHLSITAALPVDFRRVITLLRPYAHLPTAS